MTFSMPEYPLKQVLEIKHKRVDDAERLVVKREEELENEREILRQREADRDKVKQHRADKLQQLRDSLDEGTTSPEVQQKKRYIEVVDEKLEAEEQKVKAQQEQVEVAEKNLEVAKEELRDRRKEVEKLETHRKEWMKEARLEIEQKEAIELDELGSIMYLAQWRDQE